MATSRTHLANQALRHIGVSKVLADVDATTDRSAGATACRDFIDDVVDELLRDFDWPFAGRTSSAAGLALVEADPSEEWLYSYRLPSDLLAIRRVHNGLGTRRATDASREVWALAYDDDGPLLYTDYESTDDDPLRVAYTARVTDMTKWPPDLAQAAALLLASYIAPSLTEGDALKLGERAMAKYLLRIDTAKANAANEAQPDIEPDNALLSARTAS